MKHFSFSFAVIAVLLFTACGCSSDEETSTTMGGNTNPSAASSQASSPTAVAENNSEGRVSDTTEKSFSFRVNAHVGDKYKLVSYADVEYNGAATGRFQIIEEIEITKVSDKQFTYKSVTNEEVTNGNDVGWTPGQGPDVNHLVIKTADEYGNTLSTEGSDSTTVISDGKEYPNYFLKVGDSWEYTETFSKSGKHYVSKVKNKIDSIDIINGVDYLVVTSTYSGDDEGTVKQWFEAGNPTVTKSEKDSTSSNLVGQSMHIKENKFVLNNEGKPILP